jgi:hypothetical protein
MGKSGGTERRARRGNDLGKMIYLNTTFKRNTGLVVSLLQKAYNAENAII